MVRAALGPELFGPPKELMNSPNWPQWYLHLPLAELDKAIGYSMPLMTSFLVHHRRDGFWTASDASADFEHFDFPALHIVGYYDFFFRETVNSFQQMQKRAKSRFARQNQQLVLGPWTHATGSRKAGDLQWEANAELDFNLVSLKWFDRYLKTPANVRATVAPVRYYVMGTNTWKESTSWPPPHAIKTPFYLHSHGGTNPSDKDGFVNQQRPEDEQTKLSFVSDPWNPVPAEPDNERQYTDVGGPHDQQKVQNRDDVLVYSTDVLDQSVTFTGPIEATLYVSANTPDADWVVMLIDRHPTGYCHNLATGIQRSSFRNSDTVLEPLVPGEIYEMRADMGHSAAQIAEGHRLQVQICGSHFPMFDRNTNTGEGPLGSKTLTSTQQIYHSQKYASHVHLPLIEENKGSKNH